MFGKIRCLFGHHKWNMYAGYGRRVHIQAVCVRRGCGMTGKEYLGLQ